MKVFNKQKGFTLIELLIVVAIIGMMLSVSLPVSFSMYNNYKSSLKAQEVMIFISKLKRESFLYSEMKILSSKNNMITIDGKAESFDESLINVDLPIVFYRNGTTSGGTVKVSTGGSAYLVTVRAPLGDLVMTRAGAE